MKSIMVLLLVLIATAAHGEIYTWKDARGTVFYTNSLNEIPARYLKKARVYDVATGKTGGLATAQPPAGAAAPAGSPGPTPVQPSPAPSPVAAPALPVPAGPPAMAPASPPGPPGSEVTAPRSQPRESRSQRRTQRRRDYSVPEEE